MNVLATLAVLAVIGIVAVAMQNRLVARRAAVQHAWSLLHELMREHQAAASKDLNPNEMATLEQRLALAERIYNDEAVRYNQLLETLPWSLLARSAGFKPAKLHRREDGRVGG